jgi:hypothetical protein
VMDQNTTALERAFQLAKSGRCGSIEVIRLQLKTEGYYTDQIIGKGLSKQLRAIIKSVTTEDRGAGGSAQRTDIAAP